MKNIIMPQPAAVKVPWRKITMPAEWARRGEGVAIVEVAASATVSATLDAVGPWLLPSAEAAETELLAARPARRGVS